MNGRLASMLFVICLNASCQIGSRTKMGTSAQEGTISGTIMYLGRPAANAAVLLVSYRDRKCYRRTAEKVSLYGKGHIELPKGLSEEERDWVDECAKLAAAGQSDEEGKFHLAVRAKRWQSVRILWGEPREATSVVICKVRGWIINSYVADGNSNPFWIVERPLFFMHEGEHKELILQLDKPIGKEGRCRTFPSSASE